MSTITAITTSRHHIALKHPFVTALRRVESVAFVRVLIKTDTGLYGIGEAPPTVAITGEDMSSIESDITRIITPLLLHQPLDNTLCKALHASLAKNSAKAAVDMALYDLLARKKGVSLVEYLHGSACSLETVITISLEAPEEMRSHALQAYERGCSKLKIKLGSNDGKDLQRLVAIRNALPDATLLVDANQAWSEQGALEMLEQMSELHIALIEQPLKSDAYDAMVRLTCKSSIPILADESAFDLEGVKKVYAMHAADMVNIKLMKCGGISKALEILEFCRAKQMRCMMGSMLEGPHSIAAAAQLAMCYRDVIAYVDLDSPLLYADTALAEQLHYESARITLRHDACH